MVERNAVLDTTFEALANFTRRGILRRVAKGELSVSDIARPYRNVSFAAISKHLQVLKDARLIEKRRNGKFFLIKLSPDALIDAADYLEQYKKLWEGRLDSLEAYLKTMR